MDNSRLRAPAAGPLDHEGGPGIGTWALEGTTRLITWSDARARIYGLASAADGARDLAGYLELVHLDDRSRVASAIDRALMHRVDFEQCFRIVRADGDVRDLLSRAEFRHGAPGAADGLIGWDVDVTGLALPPSTARCPPDTPGPPSSDWLCRLALDALPALIAVLDLNGKIVAVNEAWLAYARANGASSAAAVSIGADYLGVARRASNAGVREAAEALAGIEAVLAGRTAHFSGDYECASPTGTQWYAMDVVALHDDPSGERVGAVVSHLDLSDRRRAAERQMILMRELAHRGKNLLGVVQSIAAQTIDGAETLDAANHALAGRLQALARSYGRLTDEAFEGALLDEILEAELATYGNRAEISGPKLMLTAKVAQTFALIVHELATNAVKYGALSVPSGTVAVTWRTIRTNGDHGSGPRLRLTWQERGGPPVRPPQRQGFGSTLVLTVAAADFGCTPHLTFAPEGIVYEIDAPLEMVGAVLDDSPVRDKLRSETLLAFYDAWARLVGSSKLADYGRFDRERFVESGGLTIAVCEPSGAVRLIEVGHSLVERMGRPATSRGAPFDPQFGAVDSYARCARLARPSYEQLRFDFGDGDPVTFERLLVPYSSDGRRVTHVAGIAVFSSSDGAQPPPSANAP